MAETPLYGRLGATAREPGPEGETPGAEGRRTLNIPTYWTTGQLGYLCLVNDEVIP